MARLHRAECRNGPKMFADFRAQGSAGRPKLSYTRGCVGLRLPQNGTRIMAYVITKACLGCKYSDCVVVCPVDCFHEGDRMLYIDPDECVCCGACVPECPVEAIIWDVDVPEQMRDYVALNAEMSQ